ncbi:MAG TPA: LysR family transcriptional regulator [Candidatus Saccharimonadales bacterium]
MEDRLVKFAKIVDAGSFTRAARLMRISQPALTAAVQKLERELRADLLIRSRHSLALTAAGKIAYQTGKSLLAQTQNLQVQISQTGAQKLAVNIGMIDSIAELLFADEHSIDELEEQARLSLTVDNSTRLIEQVEHDQLDAAFIAKPERLPSVLQAEVVAAEPLIFVAHRDIAGSVLDEMTKHQRVTSFLSYNQSSQTAHLITDHFTEQGVNLRPAFYSTSPGIMLQLTLAKRGSAVLPFSLVRQQLPTGELVSIDIGNSPRVLRHIVCIHRRGRIVPPQIERSSKRIQQQLQDLQHQSLDQK